MVLRLFSDSIKQHTTVLRDLIITHKLLESHILKDALGNEIGTINV